MYPAADYGKFYFPGSIYWIFKKKMSYGPDLDEDIHVFHIKHKDVGNKETW